MNSELSFYGCVEGEVWMRVQRRVEDLLEFDLRWEVDGLTGGSMPEPMAGTFNKGGSVHQKINR